MSIPIMLAAGIFEIKDLAAVPDLGSFLPVLLIGTITAAIVGYLSIKWLLGYLNKHSLVVFSIYCVAVWLVTFIITLLRG